MDLQEIAKLTRESVSRLTSDQYKAAFEDQTTGQQFAVKVNDIENAPRTATRPRGSVRGEEASAPAAIVETSFDPSFDDQPAAPAAAVVESAQPAAQPAALAELAIWRYQPKDAQGRAVGGEQVFKYDPTLPVDDPKSLASQLTKAHSNATTALKARKTQAVIDSVKEVATAYKEPTFLDPAQHPNAEAVNELTRNAIANGTLSALNLFKQNHPEFPMGEDTAAALVKWVGKSGRNPSDSQTWELAWQALKPYLAAPAPEVPAPAPVVAPVAAATAAAAPAEPAPTRRYPIATGLSSVDGGEDYTPAAPLNAGVKNGVRLTIDGKTQVMDLRTWDRLPSDTQKRVLRNSANAAAVNAMYLAEDERKAAARSGR
jgi:hypothetical protein